MNRTQELENLILHHKALYYQGRPEINDIEFDNLEQELKCLDPSNPVLSTVGNTPTTSDKIKHDSKMLSLGKTYKEEELFTWAEADDVISMYKIDGVSCSLVYEGSTLKVAKTRGDGSFGENITQKIFWLNNIPKNIKIKSCEIRGELFCTEENFFKLSKEMEKIGLDKPSSQRNIVAGLISRKDHLELCRYISFKAFDIITSELAINTELDKHHLLKSCKFDLLEIESHKSKKSILEAVADAKDFMMNGDYQIDGLVFVYNSIEKHHELGETAHHPRYKIAFKFQGETKETVIKEILWSVSRNGILTPVAHIDDTIISGATISKVTLHNFGLVNQYQLKIGDKIEIIRSGEVIPKFMRVIISNNDNEFVYPKVCPSCESNVFVEDIRLYCRNKKCPAILKESILNFIQKIGIEDLSSKRLDEFLSKKMITSIQDLYDLKIDDLLKLDKVKEKLATKLINNIQKSKEVDLVTFLSSLGIIGGAYNKCEKVVHSGYNTIEKIMDLSVDQLIAIDSFAQKSSEDFMESLSALHPLINSLLQKGFSFEEKKVIDSILTGKKICITGSLSRSRSLIEADIRDLGGIITSSVSKTTDYLLTNDTDSASSKFKKAKTLKIEIINEDFLEKLQN